ncbi:MAG: type I restriction enzyme HsdR N-terminal domain-containing protein [Marinilabiliaceae bacterium]|nr:type I restriction enzyme HsdR N-terminal domain-containing protein [Marinilabiliaceae bacterium]
MKEKKQHIFDPIRKKLVVLTPEEFVRQYFIDFLINQLGYPKGLITVEKSVIVNGMRQRADILIYNRKGKPVIIVECKAPEVEIGQATIEQAARYNLSLGVKYLAITNGKTSYCVELDSSGLNHKLLTEFPTAEEVIN